jgi:hypothetical protein
VAPVKFLIVGSTLHSDNPRDLDLVGLMTIEAFAKEFGLSWPELNTEIKKESPIAKLYHAKCRGATLILKQLFDKRHIDFHFLPTNVPWGAQREITLDDLKTID